MSGLGRRTPKARSRTGTPTCRVTDTTRKIHKCYRLDLPTLRSCPSGSNDGKFVGPAQCAKFRRAALPCATRPRRRLAVTNGGPAPGTHEHRSRRGRNVIPHMTIIRRSLRLTAWALLLARPTLGGQATAPPSRPSPDYAQEASV